MPNSPAESTNTTPLVITGGIGELISRDTQAGVSTVLPCDSSSLNATMAPFGVGLAPGIFKSGCSGPQIGARTQRVPSESCQVDKPPQIPRPPEPARAFAPSGGVRYNGSRISLDVESSRYSRSSQVEPAIRSRFL